MKTLRPVIVLLVVLMVPVAVGAQLSLISVEDEIELGRRANAEIRQQVPEITDAQVTRYVRSIGERLARRTPGPRYPYSFAVANYREINAFALPGGPIWVHRGLIQAATNESQLAGVLAHEVAHVARRHAASQLTKSMVANGLLGILGAFLGNTGAAGFAQMAASVAANGMFLKFSRDDERDADRVGLQIMRAAGWDARGMVELFEMLRREQGRAPGAVATFFSSHPSPADRISALQAEIARSRGGTRDTAQFRAIKARLLRMPPPREMPRE